MWKVTVNCKRTLKAVPNLYLTWIHRQMPEVVGEVRGHCQEARLPVRHHLAGPQGHVGQLRVEKGLRP